MTNDSITRKLNVGTPIGIRSSRSRWMDRVNRNASILEIRRWKEIVRNRAEWQQILEQAKINKGLQIQG